MTHLPALRERLQGLGHKAGVTDAVRDSVLTAYRAYGSDTVVAVCSSATADTAVALVGVLSVLVINRAESKVPPRTRSGAPAGK